MALSRLRSTTRRPTLAILILKLLEPPQLPWTYPSVLLLPLVECLLANAHLAADLNNLGVRLSLAKGKGDLLFCVVRLPNGKILSDPKNLDYAKSSH
jgi:hypothetical protein